LVYYVAVAVDMVIVAVDMVIVEVEMVVVQVGMVIVQVDMVIVQVDHILADPYTLYRFLKIPKLKIYMSPPKERILRQKGIP